MSSTRIQMTKNYALFKRGTDNRPLNVRKHRRLEKSMKLYGFLRSFPIVAVREKDGTLFVKDGQHRLALAETLGLAVYWVEEETNFDVAVVNCAAEKWQLKDYAQKFATNGLKPYREGIEFATQNHLPIGTAFALLSGTTSFGNCEEAFIGGTFKVKDRAWADAVAGVYVPLCAMSSGVRNARFLLACMAVCRVDGFDTNRLIGGAEKCRDQLLAYSTRDAYLDMMEKVYNFGRRQLVGLKAAALMAMRDRVPAKMKGTDNKPNEAA